MKRSALVLFPLALALLSGCAPSISNNDSSLESEPTSETQEDSSPSVPVVSTSIDIEGTPSVLLNDDSIAIPADQGIENGSNGIAFTKGGTFRVTGQGATTLYIDAGEEEVTLVLDDLTLETGSRSPICVASASKANLVLLGENSLSASSSFVNIGDLKSDGSIFSKCDLHILGEGSLSISSPKHGIVAKDSLFLEGGDIAITAKNHGLQVNDTASILVESLGVTAGKDAIHAENADVPENGNIVVKGGELSFEVDGDGLDASGSVDIEGGHLKIVSGGGSSIAPAEDPSTKGVKADITLLIQGGILDIDSSDDSVHCNGDILIQDGTLNLSSGDDGIHADGALRIENGTITIRKSYEGLEGNAVEILGGAIDLVSSDDGINAAGGADGSSLGGRPGANSFDEATSPRILIAGGNVHVNAAGDGVDANGFIEISGGVTVIDGPTSNGDGALDYDATASITGGTFLAIGSSGMAMNFSSASQGSILQRFASCPAGSEISISAKGGETIFSHTSLKSFASVLISSPELEKGNTYTLSAGSQSIDIALTDYLYGTGQNPGRPR